MAPRACKTRPEHLGLSSSKYEVWRCVDKDGKPCARCVRAVTKGTASRYLALGGCAGPACPGHGKHPKLGVAGTLQALTICCEGWGVDCEEVALEVAMFSEKNKGRCRGKFCKGSDCKPDIVLPWAGWGKRGLAVEVNGRDHRAKKAKKRDRKRLRTAGRDFEVLVVPAHAGHTAWFLSIDDMMAEQVKKTSE